MGLIGGLRRVCPAGRLTHHTSQNTTPHYTMQTLKLLRKASPTALQVTLRALREGAHLPLEETFAMEYRLSQVS